MKKTRFLMIFGSFCVLTLFLGCDFNTPPETHDNSYSTDLERKDVLALKHLQIPNISKDTLASYVMDFINIVSTASEAEAGRSVHAASATPVVITKTTEIIHTVETGFAETTADKRSAGSIIGPGQIPFYVFTLENQETGRTGFALGCGDNRIGNILAVAEEGNYDDENPFFSVFYSCLDDYIEDTIAIYNSVTEADIENALSKINENARATAPNLPVTEVGKITGLIPVVDKKILDTVRWNQGDPYNKIINKERTLLQGYEKDYRYVTGCTPTAIAIIMAYHGNKRAIAGMSSPYIHSKAPGYENIKYDWSDMNINKNNNSIPILMYEIGLPNNVNSIYSIGYENKYYDPLKKGPASTSSYNTKVRIAYRNMGYRDPGEFKRYETSGIKASIDKEEPVQVSGNSRIKYYILGIPIYETGHSWVIDGYAKMTTTVKDKYSGKEIEDYPLDYVHCNVGWGESWIYNSKDDIRPNGWYISGIFNTNDIPEATRSVGQDGYFQYNIQMLTGIRPQ